MFREAQAKDKCFSYSTFVKKFLREINLVQMEIVAKQTYFFNNFGLNLDETSSLSCPLLSTALKTDNPTSPFRCYFSNFLIIKET